MTPLLHPAARLRSIRRLPFPALAAMVCLLFAAAGLALLDDYGEGNDTRGQRRIAISNADYIMGDSDALPTNHNRFYGLAIEMPLLMAERTLGLQDSRDIFLMRHLLTHLFFIVGGFLCGLLVYRMFGSRWVALLAMLLFLLHPRLYVHSFFNSKDVPFMVMFMIALYLTHRAFQRDRIGAFALLGVVVGLAVNMRPFALLLPAAVLAMRALDWGFATNPLRRKRILVTGGVFAGALMLAIYVSQPYYWENPLRFFDSLQTLSQHPTLVINRFMGENIRADAVPPEYIPVWFGITTPPAALLLGGIGAAAALLWGIRRPARVLRAGRLRFMLLHLGCFALPIIATALWQFHIYNGWRHLYFLWAPFCLVAAAGLHWLAGNAGAWGRNRRGYLIPARRTAAYVFTGAALAGTLTVIVSSHPHQYTYFNSLAGWSAKESIGESFDMAYWTLPYRQGIEYLLARYPQSPLYIYAGRGDNDGQWQLNALLRNSKILRDDARKWLFFVDEGADFYMVNHGMIYRYPERVFAEIGKPPGPVVHSISAYDSPILTITAPGLSDTSPTALADVYRAKYRDATADGLTVDAVFDVYFSGDIGTLRYAKTDCPIEDTSARFFLHVFPKDERDLPIGQGEYGFDNRSFAFNDHGARVDDKCWAVTPLPDYPIALIRTGQTGPDGATLWQAEINPDAQAQFGEMAASIAGLQPTAAGHFRLYHDDRRLIYYRESCNAADTHARFFLHLFPTNNNDLPQSRRQYGFDNLGFNFSEHGAHRNGKCLAAVPLPNYQIARIRTGQYLPGQGQLWQAELPTGQ